jgi:hypothetical protein
MPARVSQIVSRSQHSPIRACYFLATEELLQSTPAKFRTGKTLGVRGSSGSKPPHSDIGRVAP